MVLQWKICETVFKVGLTTVFFYTVDQFNRKCVLNLSYDITAKSLNSYVLLTTILRQNFE